MNRGRGGDRGQEPRSKGAGSLQEAGEERVGSGIPAKVVGTKRNRKKFSTLHNIYTYF